MIHISQDHQQEVTLFYKYSKINKQNMSVSRNGVSIWNRLSSKFHEMPKTKFKCNSQYAPSETLVGKRIY